jgi:hypothetical protein
MGKSARNANRAYREAKGRIGTATHLETEVLAHRDRSLNLWNGLHAGRKVANPEYEWVNSDAGLHALAGVVSTMTGWADGPRVVFDVDPDLLAALGTNLPDGMPAAVLDRLPFATFAVTCEFGLPDDTLRFFGFLYHYDEQLDIPMLLGLGLDATTDHTVYNFIRIDDLVRDGKLRSLTGEEFRASVEELPGVEYTDLDAERQLLSQHMMLAVLAYLSSDQPDVENVTPPEFAHKAHSTGRTLPTVYRTGWAVGAALRAAERQDRETAGSDGQAVRPHLRRAHWHLYWTGPRTDPQPLLKWLSPIAVGTGDVRTVRPVA